MNPTITFELSAGTLKLSETLTATLRIEGNAPLIVTLPKPLLEQTSSLAWQISPVGPATVEKLIDGEERWTQVYRLDPFAVGENVPVTFSPIEVTANAGKFTLAVPEKTVAVSATITAEGSATLRPPAGLESIPNPAATSPTPVGWIFALLAFSVIVAAAIRTRIRRQSPALNAAEIALNRLTKTDVASSSFADDISGIVRRFMLDDAGKPWPTMTTDEIAGSEIDPPLIDVLRLCDAERFTTAPLSETDRESMRDQVRAHLVSRLPKRA